MTNTDFTFQEPTGIVIGYDDNIPEICKLLISFNKDHELFKINGGWIEGREVKLANVIELSKISSKQALVVTTVSLLNSLLVQLVFVLNTPLQHFVVGLEQKSQSVSSGNN